MECLGLSEEPLEEDGHLREIVKIEDSPANNHQQQAVYMQEHGRHLINKTEQRVFLKHDDDAEVHTPDDEVPGSPVPHASEEPHHENIQCLMTPVATHRDIDIIAEETKSR